MNVILLHDSSVLRFDRDEASGLAELLAPICNVWFLLERSLSFYDTIDVFVRIFVIDFIYLVIERGFLHLYSFLKKLRVDLVNSELFILKILFQVKCLFLYFPVLFNVVAWKHVENVIFLDVISD